MKSIRLDNFELKTLQKDFFYLAGIIPVSNKYMSFGFPWNDCMMPVGDNYTALEKAVYDAAGAGCQTIWLVCDEDLDPLIRRRLGEWVYDPVTFERFETTAVRREKKIPIYYVANKAEDRERRDCLAWSIVYGACVAHNVSRQLSRWLRPDMYYVSFPYSVTPSVFIKKEVRPLISRKADKHRRFFMEHDGKTVRDGEMLPFTFNRWDTLKLLDILKRRENDRYMSTDHLNIPTDERWPEQFYTLETVFGCITTNKSMTLTPPWYYPIQTWEGYCDYLGSQAREETFRKTSLQNPNKRKNFPQWSPIGQDDDVRD